MQNCYLSGFLLHHDHLLLLSLPPPAPLHYQNRNSRASPACSSIPSPVSGEVVPQTLDNHTFSSSSSSSSAAAAAVKKSYQPRNGVRWSQRKAAVVQVQEADDLGSALSRFQGQLQVQDLNTILRYFGESKRWNDGIQLFNWMQKCDNVNVASYSTFFKYMGKSHNLVKALQVYNDIGDECTRYNASVCNALLGCFVRHGKFDTSINLFEQMKKGGLTPDIVTYSTLLSGCTKVKDGYSKSLKLMEELKSNGLHMDSVIYGTVLAVCASNNLSKEAENFFQQMVDEGCEPNLFHYGSLLNAYSVDGDYAKAENLVKNMKSSGIEPNKVILTTLLKVYVRGGLFEKSRELLVKLGTLGHTQDKMPFCILMDGLTKAGQIDEAKAIFQEMKMKGVKSANSPLSNKDEYINSTSVTTALHQSKEKEELARRIRAITPLHTSGIVDGYSHSIMISACCRHGHIKDAKQLAEDFEGNNYKYDLVMLNTLLRTYCQAGEMEHVMKVLRKMDDLTISPDWNTFQILIKYFYKQKMYNLAFRTVEDMYRKDHQLDEVLILFQLLAINASSMLGFGKRFAFL